MKNLFRKLKKLAIPFLTSVLLTASTGCFSVSRYLEDRGKDFIDPFKVRLGYTTLKIGACARATDAFQAAVGMGDTLPASVGVDGRKPLFDWEQDYKHYIGIPYVQIKGLVYKISKENVPWSYLLATHQEGYQTLISPDTRILVQSENAKQELMEKAKEREIGMASWMTRKSDSEIKKQLEKKIEVANVKDAVVRNEEKYFILSPFLGGINQFEAELEKGFMDKYLCDMFLTPEFPNFFSAKYKRSVSLPRRKLRETLDFETRINMLLVGAEIGFRPVELCDFLAGFVGFDFAKDDKK